jgi:hypothetical protein
MGGHAADLAPISADLALRRSVPPSWPAGGARLGQSVRASGRTVMAWSPMRPTAATATDRRFRRGLPVLPPDVVGPVGADYWPSPRVS